MGSASGTFKVIDPAGAKVYKYWEHIGSEEVGHLPQGMSVVVTGEVGRQVRIVQPVAGCVFLESLEQIASAPVASAPDASPAPSPDSDDDDSELEQGASSSGVTARVLARRRGLVVEGAPETPAAPVPAVEAPAAPAPAAAAPDVEAPAAPAPAPGDAEMAEAPETQDQANARRRDEITANLDQLAINRPNEYTTLVGALVRLTRDLVGLGASV